MTNNQSKRLPDKVHDTLEDKTEILLISKDIGSSYPCQPELVANGVILHNSCRTRVFKYSEMWEIITDKHDRWQTDVEAGTQWTHYLNKNSKKHTATQYKKETWKHRSKQAWNNERMQTQRHEPSRINLRTPPRNPHNHSAQTM